MSNEKSAHFFFYYTASKMVRKDDDISLHNMSYLMPACYKQYNTQDYGQYTVSHFIKGVQGDFKLV